MSQKHLTPSQMFATGNASVETFQWLGRGETAINVAIMVGNAINDRLRQQSPQPSYNDHDIEMQLAQTGSTS